jgi:hypothetical protein
VVYYVINYLLLTLPSSRSEASEGVFQFPMDQSVTLPENFSFVISSPDNLREPTKEPNRSKNELLITCTLKDHNHCLPPIHPLTLFIKIRPAPFSSGLSMNLIDLCRRSKDP